MPFDSNLMRQHWYDSSNYWLPIVVPFSGLPVNRLLAMAINWYHSGH